MCQYYQIIETGEIVVTWNGVPHINVNKQLFTDYTNYKAPKPSSVKIEPRRTHLYKILDFDIKLNSIYTFKVQ